MKKIKNQKGFIQIPLLVAIVVSAVLASVGTGFFMYINQRQTVQPNQAIESLKPIITPLSDIAPQESPKPVTQSRPGPSPEDTLLKIEKCKAEASQYAELQEYLARTETYDRLKAQADSKYDWKSYGYNPSNNRTFSEQLEAFKMALDWYKQDLRQAQNLSEEAGVKAYKRTYDQYYLECLNQ